MGDAAIIAEFDLLKNRCLTNLFSNIF